MNIYSEKKDGSQRQSNPFRVHTAPPAHIEKQRDFVLRVLREAGNAGVNRDHFLQGTGPCNGRRCTQVGARLDELAKQGYIFESKAIPGRLFVQYYLRREPTAPTPAPSRGWKAQAFHYGRKQPASVPVQQELLSVATGSDNSFLAYESGEIKS